MTAQVVEFRKQTKKRRREPSPRRSSAPLTNAMIAALRPGEHVWDATIKQLFAKRIGDDLGKPRVSWRVMVDLPVAVQRESLHGRRKLERVIGRWPDLSPARARDVAVAAIKAIREGGDVKNGAPRAPGGITLRQAYDAYVADRRRLNRRPGTLRAYDFAMRRWPEDWLDKPLAVVASHDNRPEIAALHARLTKSSGPVAADQSVRLMKFVLDHARRTRPTLPDWPRKMIEPNPVGKRGGMSLDQIPDWWARVRTVPDPAYREMMLFGLLTGLRPNDVAEARREHLDAMRRTLLVPEPKGGESKAFTLYLSKAAVACAQRAMAAHEAPRIFTTRLGRKPRPMNARWVDADRKSRGFPRAERGHGLRHTWSNVAEGLGIDVAERGRMMNHAASSVTQKYGDRDANARRWHANAERIAAAMLAKTRPRP